MEEQRFDGLARSLGRDLSRRGILRSLLGSTAGGLAGLGVAGVNAAPGGGKGGNKTKPPCCPAGFDTLCPVDGRPTCVNSLTDPDHCGACGNACASGVCVNGTCSSTICTPGST